MPQTLVNLWPVLLALISFLVALATSVHILLRKRDSRASIAWIGLVWLAPLLGAFTYLLLGINRIHSRAKERIPQRNRPPTPPLLAYSPDALAQFVPEALKGLSRLSSQVSQQPLLGGNRINPLWGGDEAFPRMLKRIQEAEQSITLSTFILRNDTMGRAFVDALAQAQARGVAVRLLVDFMGLRYSLPTVKWRLRRQKLIYAEFMPPRWPNSLPFLNLRNHRKLLICDGLYGFTGGMNISAQNCHKRGEALLEDIHFELEGPVVTELQSIFAEDWFASCGETLTGQPWFQAPVTPGSTLARAIADGPDDRFNTLRQVMLGAIHSAHHHLRIMTPYFVPDTSLSEALITAALRGVKVQILLPSNNNLRIVDWACRAHLDELIQQGVEVAFSSGCFNHSKLFMVDEGWCLPGSANWDNRSLALNFECNLECYDEWLTRRLNQHFDQRFQAAERLSLEQIQQWSLGVRLRNATAALLSPYL